MKNLEEMSERELLIELVEDKRKLEKLQYVKYALLIIFGVVLLVMLYSFFNKVTTSMETFEKAVVELQESSKQISEMIDNANIPENSKEIQGYIDYIKQLLNMFGVSGNN